MQINLEACETFESGSKAYFSVDYQKAVVLYEECLQGPSYALHSNLASTYYKTCKMGRSLFSFSKSPSMEPKASGFIFFNLNLVKESLIDQEESEFEEQVERNGTFEYKVLFVLVMLSSGFLLRVKSVVGYCG